MNYSVENRLDDDLIAYLKLVFEIMSTRTNLLFNFHLLKKYFLETKGSTYIENPI